MTGTADGEAVVDRALVAAVAEFGSELSAAYVIGSLAHGGFAPLVSDVDVMLVLGSLGPSTAARVDGVRERVRGDGIDELASRLSIFWSDEVGVRRGTGRRGRLPEIDRVDLLESGRLELGTDCRDGAIPPSSVDVIVQAAEFALAAFDDAHLAGLRDPDVLVGRGPRPVTKAVLFPVRFLYTLSTGRIGHNDAAAAWYAARDDHAELVVAATDWRRSGLSDPERARDLLRRHLRPLHRSFVGEYVSALSDRGEEGLAERLATWGARLR